MFCDYVERLLEDHDTLMEAVRAWGSDSDNSLMLAERVDKYDIFLRPEVTRCTHN